MKNRRNYYRILQVQPDAHSEIVHSSYRTIMHKLKQHPDLGGEHWNAAIINEAYATLSDGNKRAEYDKKLFEHYTKKPLPTKNSLRKPSITIFCPFCKRPLARKAEPGESCPSCRSPLQSESSGKGLQQDYQRSAERMKKSGTLRYYSSWPEKGKEAEILDLSPIGIRFLSAEKPDRKSVVKLSSPLLKAIAEVTNVREKKVPGKILFSVGARFLTVRFTNPKGSFFSTVI